MELTRWITIAGLSLLRIEGDRVTRLSGDPLNLKLIRANTEIRRNFFSHRVVNAWNQIPTTIKNARTTSSFKSQFNNYMLQQQQSNHQN